MAAYRLLALDMDGTLLTSDKRITPRTREAIRDAARRGVAVALSTGRAINELSAYRDDLSGAVRYASLLSGGQVYDMDREATIRATTFKTQTALAIARHGIAEDAMVHVLTTSTTAACPRDVERMDEVGMGVYQQMFRSICTLVSDVPAFIQAHEGEVCKVNLYHKDQQSRRRTFELLSQIDAQMAFAEQTSIEFTPVGVTKAVGLQVLCDHLGCTLAECIAVGDAPNDTDALQAAGLSVAMGNATDDVKELADVIVADNDHDGIVEVIERFL
ncbi:MAG: HAD family phosphatase [Atopobiaceae bacterium]|nr:HAD family phosphatase [Atopobiaceae bacterium]